MKRVFSKVFDNRNDARKAKCDALAKMLNEMNQINREMKDLMVKYGRRNELLQLDASNKALTQCIVTERSIAVREYAFGG